jgi:aspartate ammonia-lyase
VYDLVMERGLLTREQLDQALNPEAMTAPRAVSGKAKAKSDRPAKR